MQAPLQSTANAGLHSGIKVLVYGRAGTGKTYLCSTAPAPVILSAEAGVLSLKKFNIPYWQINNIVDFRNAASWCFNSYEARQFQTICLDSVSDIAEQILNAELAKTRDPRKAYGEVLTQMMDELRKFRNLQGPNIYYTAKQETSKDALGGMFSRPMLPGQALPGQVPYFPDELFQLLVGKDQNGQEYRALRTRPDAFNEAKDRSGVLAEYEPAHLGHVFTKILNGG